MTHTQCAPVVDAGSDAVACPARVGHADGLIAQQIQARDAHYETVGQILLGLDPDSTVFAT